MFQIRLKRHNKAVSDLGSEERKFHKEIIGIINNVYI